MLANKDSTDSTMSRALAHSSNTLDSAILLDVDRTDEDRAPTLEDPVSHDLAELGACARLERSDAPELASAP